jgi:hypothetical protein
MQPRMVALIAVLSLASGWLVSNVVSENTQPPASADPRSSGPRPLGVQEAPAPYTQQLRLRMQEHPRSPSPGRNPFVFGPRRPAAPAAAHTESAAPAVEAPPMPIAPQLRFDLSGIAMNREGDAQVFTAIVNDNGTLVFVKAGDALSNGYSVVRVEEASVVIADAAGVERLLRLK